MTILKIILSIMALFVGASDVKTIIESYKKKQYYWTGLSIMFAVYWAALLFWLAYTVIV